MNNENRGLSPISPPCPLFPPPLFPPLKLLPAGALQQARVVNLMGANSLSDAQTLIKSPTAKSVLAMAEYSDKYSYAFKAVPYLNRSIAVAGESERFYRADNLQERSLVVTAGVANYGMGGIATTAGVVAGAKGGAISGATIGGLLAGPPGAGLGAIVGGAVGAIAVGGGTSLLYEKQFAPEVRARIAGEKFRK